MKTKTHFAFRVDIWDDTGDSIVEHVAGIDDFKVAEATYWAAIARAGQRRTLPCGRASGWWRGHRACSRQGRGAMKLKAVGGVDRPWLAG
jgi:hypothetical protein